MILSKTRKENNLKSMRFNLKTENDLSNRKGIIKVTRERSETDCVAHMEMNSEDK